jgi:hypothetical protein
LRRICAGYHLSDPPGRKACGYYYDSFCKIEPAEMTMQRLDYPFKVNEKPGIKSRL